MKRKTILPVTILGLGALFISACQKSPDSSIVKNKDLEGMIAQAEDQGNGAASVEGIVGEYDTYQTTFQDDALHVTVNVDAKVEIPQAEKMSIFRVRQKAIDQELLDAARKELAGDETLYDGSILEIKTRSMLEKEIQNLKRTMEEIQNDPKMTEKDIQTYLGEYQQHLDELQGQYESAPVQYAWENFPSDGKLSSVKEKVKTDETGFYQWAHGLNQSGDIYYGVSDGKNGQYTELFALNSEDRGNCLRYGRDERGYVQIVGMVADYTNCSRGIWKIEDGQLTEKVMCIIGAPTAEDLVPYSKEPVSLTPQQAKEKAEALLKTLKVTDFQCYNSGLYGEIVQSGKDENGKYPYRQVYILDYLRNIDNVFVDNSSGMKYEEGWEGDNHIKREWEGESIRIILNDSGILGFYYCTPIEITETVVEKASMKPFDEIKSIFEQMAAVMNAGLTEDESVTLQVNRVILRYTRISEPDSFDTGLLVPVWDFIGTSQSVDGEASWETEEKCIMTINAIDGSIINRELGY